MDKFFRNDEILKEPFFCKIEKMFKEIPIIEGYDIKLREVLYYDFNNYSQILHGQLIKWTKDIQMNDSFLQEIKVILHSIILMPVIYAEKNGINLSVKCKSNLYNALRILLDIQTFPHYFPT